MSVVLKWSAKLNHLFVECQLTRRIRSTGHKINMYSWEINQIMESTNFNLDSETYLHILSSSPQIRSVSYKPYGNYFEIVDDEHNCWKFNVYKKE